MQARFERYSLQVMVSAATAVAGCADMPPAGRELLLRIDQSYVGGAYADAERQATEFLTRFSSSPAVGEAHYLRGLCRVRLNRPDEARADFVAGAASSREDLAAYCEAMLGHLAFSAGDDEAAVGHYAVAVSRLPPRPPADEIHYRYAVCLQRVGQWAEARRVLARVLDAFGEGPCGEAALRRMAWRHEYFAIECGAYPRVDEATRAAGALGRRGLTVSIEFSAVDGKGAWRLLTGRYATHQLARADLPRIQAVEPGAKIVP